MSIPFDDIDYSFMYVSADQDYMNHAYICKETGQIFYSSEMYDSDDLPEDIEDPDKYLAIPHQNDLELGKSLVFEFAEKYLPEEIESRYKDLLDARGYLYKWHKVQDERQRAALEQWCIENNIEFSR